MWFISVPFLLLFSKHFLPHSLQEFALLVVVNSNYNVSPFLHTQDSFSKFNCLFINNTHESWLWQESKECWSLRNSYIFIICFFIAAVPNLFGTRAWFQGRQLFQGRGRGRWFQDVSSMLHLLCILLLILLHQLHFRSLGIRSWRLGTPVLQFRLKPCVLSSLMDDNSHGSSALWESIERGFTITLWRKWTLRLRTNSRCFNYLEELSLLFRSSWTLILPAQH